MSWASTDSMPSAASADVCTRRHAEEHGDVTELEVGVYEGDPARVAGGEQHCEVGRDDALAHAALGRERDEDPTLLGRLGAHRGAVGEIRDGVADPLHREPGSGARPRRS